MRIQCDLLGEILIINPDGVEAPTLDGVELEESDNWQPHKAYELNGNGRCSVAFLDTRILIERMTARDGQYYEIDRVTLESIILPGARYESMPVTLI